MQKLKALFPYFGGKSRVADTVWQLIGTDVKYYFEPFLGSGAVFFARPSVPKTSFEIINDADGHITNVWRSIRYYPSIVKDYCLQPSSHIDLIAARKTLRRCSESLTEQMKDSVESCDPELAGLWIWTACNSIGGFAKKEDDSIPFVATRNGVMAPALRDNIDAVLKGYRERLRDVIILCSDWQRGMTGNWIENRGSVGIFLDPPYSVKDRAKIYEHESFDVAGVVREWAREKVIAFPEARIVLAGYYEEHKSLEDSGWGVIHWKALGGYSNANRDGDNKNAHKETLFYSPGCLSGGMKKPLF